MIDCSYADYNKKKKKKMIRNDTSIKFSPNLNETTCTLGQLRKAEVIKKCTDTC